MPVMTLRVDDATRDEVDRVARAKGVTVSELLRQAIDVVIGHKESVREAASELFGDEIDVRRSDGPRSLPLEQRQVLVLLHEILARLVDETETEGQEITGHRRSIELLRGGFAGDYSDEFMGLDPELSVGECELVMDLLDMFLVLKGSLARLNADQIAELGDDPQFITFALTFRGFDFQDPREARMHSYANFLVRTGRWEDLAEAFDSKHEGGNSHSPVLAVYRRLLAAFQPIWATRITGRGLGRDEFLLDKQELVEVAKAAVHPTNR